jgi:uncharacterized protein
VPQQTSRRGFLAAGLAAPGLTLSPAPLKQPETKKPQLTYRTLGKTGLKVTTVSFGTMITSDASVIERAADLGISYFDTARGYQSGNCERMVGAALKNVRKNVTLSTKSPAKTKEALLADLDTSLRELQTDYIDIWYLHAKNKPEEVQDDLIEAQQMARKAGKIRFCGISIHPGEPNMFETIIGKNHFDVLLVVYNFANAGKIDQSIADTAKAGIGVVAMKVMAGGSKAKEENLKSILGRDGAMLAALKFSLKNPNITCAIPSMTDNDQLDQNLNAMAAGFSDSDQRILAARLREIGPIYCRMCGACSGTCAKGLPVPDVLRSVMYAEGYGEFALGREQFRTLPSELAGVRCADCSECTVHCANGVRVVERLSRAQEIFA